MKEQDFDGGELNYEGRREPAHISRWYQENQKKRTFVSKTVSLKSSPFLSQPWCREFPTCNVINMVLRAGIELEYSPNN